MSTEQRVASELSIKIQELLDAVIEHGLGIKDLAILDKIEEINNWEYIGTLVRIEEYLYKTMELLSRVVTVPSTPQGR